ncbi:hypothetical protein DFA_09699 [Cavenderia fasciculata]|uniref:Uncharacterized protein n=1 Tax=Cavenderia fasciculata TaxID=261658 RepID=F4Q8C7_CACFS|nr:uncharacterized protein DFA_09699 [Cavenderia fasciculata]EGG16027.1 hypothetical protein DFA_09699 [Cavenderia fasciculata]|eukprot:XP_004352352.1 hypothetical protein DFA_09699 [Cavenderia fasciculata]
MENNNNKILNSNRFSIREYDSIKDCVSISKISRIPFSSDVNAMEGVSQPISPEIRPKLSKKSRVVVATDNQNGQTIGSYSCNIKDVMVGGSKKRLYYMFDVNVDPNYRGMSITKNYLTDLFSLLKKDKKSDSIMMMSTTRTNVPMLKSAASFAVNPIFNQHQYAWKLEGPAALESMPSDCSNLKVWTERDTNAIKKHWSKGLGKFNFIPSNFDDLLVFNQRFHCTTYVASMNRGDRNIEASVSVWDQDLIFTLKTKSESTQRHRQLYSCYSIGGTEDEKDWLFRYLLKRVHNNQYSQGINYLFIGLSETDPIRKHFPLIPTIKDLDFVALCHFQSPDTEKLINECMATNQPIWNDPRDYGILLLYPNPTTTTTTIISQSEIPLPLPLPSIQQPLVIQLPVKATQNKSIISVVPKKNPHFASIRSGILRRVNSFETLDRYMITTAF